jgi:hypothetical protein
MGRSAQLRERLDLNSSGTGGPVHDNPRPTDEEQELAQTERMDQEEDQRSGYAPPEEADAEEE